MLSRVLGMATFVVLMPVAATALVHTRPVPDAPTRHYEAPEHRWSPGNRGLEYRLAPGTPVEATADGVVVFAGPVAGRLFVTIDHGDGLQTTYSYLRSVYVSAGQRVVGGAVLGLSSDIFQLGAKRHGQYVDPKSLLGGRTVLVPIDAPPSD